MYEKRVTRRGQWEQYVCCSACVAVRMVQCVCCSAARSGLATSQPLHVSQGVCCRVCVAECVLQCAWCTNSIYQLVQLSRELHLSCNTQQHIAPHCNTLQHPAIHCRCEWDWDIGWLRLVSPLKLQVSFAKEPYKRDDILQKRPII